MSIPFDETSAEDTTVDDDASLAATQDDTTLDDPSMNDDAVRAAADLGSDDESEPDEREDIPAQDAHALDADQPGTQDDSPIDAALGEDGQGDLAPEDDLGAGPDDDGPEDLRTAL